MFWNRAPFTRYYWRKSTAFQGIPLTKVSRKWPRISHVDAAAEVPYKDMVYFFEGDSHRRVQRCNSQCHSLPCYEHVFLQITITGPSRLMQRQSCQVIQRDSPTSASPHQSRRWMQLSTCNQPGKH